MSQLKYIIKTMCRWCHADGCEKCNYTGYTQQEIKT